MSINISDLPPPPTPSAGLDISDLPSPTSDTPASDKIADRLSGIADKVLTYNPLTALPKAIYDNSDTVQDYATGVQEGGTLGFRDEALGMLKGAGKTALEGLTGELPANKSAYEQLLDNYRKYQQQAQSAQDAAHERSPYAAGGGKLVGNIATGGEVFGAAKGLGLLGKIAVGAGMGAGQGIGESKATLENDPDANIPFTDVKVPQMALDAGLGGVLGGAGVPIAEKVIAPALAAGANKAMKYFGNSAAAKQIAATNLNAAKGGSVFGEEGQSAIANRTEELAKETAEKLGAGIPEKNADFAREFAKADAMGKTLEKPSTNALQNLSDLGADLAQNRIKIPETAANENAITKWYAGELKPSEAYDLIDTLKTIRSSNYNNEPLRNSLTNAIDDITNGANKTLDGPTLQNLNTAKSTAWSQVEPFIQNPNKVEIGTPFQTKDASDFIKESRNAKMQKLFENLMKRAGDSTAVGTDARNQLGKMQGYLNDVSNTGVHFPGVNPNEMVPAIQNQSYLNAAKQAAQGIHGETNLTWDKILGLPKQAALYGAEKLSGSAVANDISSKLLSKDPAQMLQNAKALSSMPKTAHLAEQYYKAAQMNNKQKLTNIAFQVMQNAELKEAMGGNAISNDIPGVVKQESVK